MPFGFSLNFNFNLFKNKTPPTTRPKRNVITFEEGFETLQNGITKLYNVLEGLEPNFTPDEHIKLYTYVTYTCMMHDFLFYRFSSFNFIYVQFRFYCNAGPCTICAPQLLFLAMIDNYIICIRKLVKTISNQKSVTLSFVLLII